MKSKNILLAGATGYLGQYIARELKRQNYHLTVLVRNKQKFEQLGIDADRIIDAEINSPEDLEGACKDIEVVISTVGITRQKDGLTYMDVDYQGNLNLLEEAQKSGVKKFIYVSALNGDKLRHLQIFAAKKRFVDKLKASGLAYSVIRPNGFFSDITEVYRMAEKGRVYLFGNGELPSNPIHGADLAEVCVSAIEQQEQEINIGGPDMLTQNEIAELAFEALGKSPKISYVPNWIRRLVLKVGKYVMSRQTFGPMEFFMTVLAMEMVAPQYGSHGLGEYFEMLTKAR
jgi:uncharacterized protein YbjT (DUF2867 family)